MVTQVTEKLRLTRGQRGNREMRNSKGGVPEARDQGHLTKAGTCGSVQWPLESGKRRTIAG